MAFRAKNPPSRSGLRLSRFAAVETKWSKFTTNQTLGATFLPPYIQDSKTTRTIGQPQKIAKRLNCSASACFLLQLLFFKLVIHISIDIPQVVHNIKAVGLLKEVLSTSKGLDLLQTMAATLTSLQVSSLNAEIKREEEFEMLSELESAFGNDSPLGLMTDCSSLSSSFFSVDLSTPDLHAQRRSSNASCSSPTPQDLLFTSSAGDTSPTTPMMAGSGFHVAYNEQFVKPHQYFPNYHSIFRIAEDDDHLHNQLWLDQVSMANSFSGGLPLLNSAPDMFQLGSHHGFHSGEHRGMSTVAVNPALTKSMFGNNMTGTAVSTADSHILPWSSHQSHPPSETIEPSVTFQGASTSSPRYKVEPSTPISVHIPNSGMMSSSPLSMLSPAVLKSQNDIDDLPYDSIEQALRIAPLKKHRCDLDRLSRRGYQRKRVGGVTSKAKPAVASGKTGINCELVIAQNEFACSYDGCIDKNTGKQKRFKRQEHKKRHEKTVHEKDMHEAYKCWVPDCDTAFSRTDNLKSHLRNTHSKKPGVRGNRYVATLDKNSEFYDPEWVGELDKHGYPIL